MNFIPLKADKIITNDLNRAGYSHYVVQNELNRIKNELRHWNRLDDEQKFKILSRYYLVKCDINDILELINRFNFTNYSQLVDISTKMETEDEDCIGHGKDFKWWTTYNKIHYICATQNRFNIEDINYSRDELVNLVDNKIVLPITNYQEEINCPSQHREKYRYVRLLKSYGIDVGELQLKLDENNCFIKQNGCLVPDDAYYDIAISEDHIKNYMNIAKKDISEQEIVDNTYYYVDSLIKMLQREESENYQEEIKALRKLNLKKANTKMLKRA